MIKVEMHSHTCFSKDGFITPKTLTNQCLKKRLDCVCITDHNLLQGAKEFSRQVSIRIITGEEMATGQGDVIGLFLKEEISPGLGIKKTIEKIKSQGGLVYLPHPFDEFRKSSVKIRDAEEFKNMFDIIEIFNSRTFNPKYNSMAMEFGRQNNLVTAVGSDAHHPIELGHSYMLMNDFNGPESFLENLRGATYFVKKCPFALRVYLKILKILTGKN
jgi:predicted metal-dependent phosphoesterase TrpH